ncbi:AAA family ATPase [uncultured Shewanella sp.]|uniref:AAA family ATPase n=1 Tax=uncultured Shewanella sp. TaxID=173975 RepID=UPI003703C7EF
MSKEFNNDKSIRSLEKNARSGNFYSALQLYEYYSVGKFVGKDEIKSQFFLDLAYDIFKSQNIKLKTLEIENFRVLENIRINDFDDNLNVLIGNNGAGKTTFLDAIDLSLSWLKISISKNGGSGNYIDEADINNYSTLPYATVSSTIKVNKKLSLQLELSKVRDGNIKVKNKLSEFKSVGDFYKYANKVDEDFNMPLLAYYNVMRSYDVNPKDLRNLDNLSDSTVTDKFDAYEKSLSGKTDFSSFVKWYKKFDDILSRRKSSPNRVEALSALGFTEDFLNRLKTLSESSDDAKKIYSEVQAALPVEEKEVIGDILEKNKKIINDVVSSFMAGFSDIEVQIEPMLDLIIKKNNKAISVMKLSQGEKTLLALVLDIARRLIILNPSRENPLDGQGIILIDEFDLHLHPIWQKNIARNLKNTFPNCQFFLTTHSPSVISELDRKHVFMFNVDDNGSISVSHPPQSFGLTITQVVNELMGPVDGQQMGRSQYVEDELEKINSLIDKETVVSLKQAKNMVKALEKLLHGDIPELVKVKVKLDFLLE